MPEPAATDVSDVRKTITVPAPVDTAFAVYVEHPGEWLPPEHAFIRGGSEVVIEPRLGDGSTSAARMAATRCGARFWPGTRRTG